MKHPVFTIIVLVVVFATSNAIETTCNSPGSKTNYAKNSVRPVSNKYRCKQACKDGESCTSNFLAAKWKGIDGMGKCSCACYGFYYDICEDTYYSNEKFLDIDVEYRTWEIKEK